MKSHSGEAACREFWLCCGEALSSQIVAQCVCGGGGGYTIIITEPFGRIWTKFVWMHEYCELTSPLKTYLLSALYSICRYKRFE
jgi:hypothetical protein